MRALQVALRAAATAHVKAWMAIRLWQENQELACVRAAWAGRGLMQAPACTAAGANEHVARACPAAWSTPARVVDEPREVPRARGIDHVVLRARARGRVSAAQERVQAQRLRLAPAPLRPMSVSTGMRVSTVKPTLPWPHRIQPEHVAGAGGAGAGVGALPRVRHRPAHQLAHVLDHQLARRYVLCPRRTLRS